MRQDSVYRALMNLDCSENDFILVHDAVRPFISRDKILELIKEVKNTIALSGSACL
ncbi:MAG: 2-C-methyl-D-erythritol 4-phosphate cytidylyltransferase [Ignavibacteria bacterium]|nr:2-C-methyl-D-erythritol 4-phosphate cytidylyltransferase [Ignavibacteria bacterium]